MSFVPFPRLIIPIQTLLRVNKILTSYAVVYFLLFQFCLIGSFNILLCVTSLTVLVLRALSTLVLVALFRLFSLLKVL